MSYIKVRESALFSRPTLHIKSAYQISVNIYKGDYNTDNTLAKQTFTEYPTSLIFRILYYCKVPDLNSKVYVTFPFFQTSLCFAFIGKIFQLACSCSLNFRPHVDGYAVWLQKALHPAASLVSDHVSPYHVTRKNFVVYRFLEIDDAVIFCH